MGIDPNILTPEGWHAAIAALEWQMDLGVTEITGEDPVDRYALPDTLKAAAAKTTAPPTPMIAPTADPAAAARAAASAAPDLAALRAALTSFEHCELKRGAKTTVFADGNPSARILILTEAPSRAEDQEGRPFVGRTGLLLDRMFTAIGLSRTSPDPATALYVTTTIPWRTPQNRDPSPEEIAMMRPFVERHIQLANPTLIVAMGNAACQCLLNASGSLRLRGQWAQALGRPVLPMIHPAYLLRNPAAKRDAWADLLSLKRRLS